LRKKKQFFFLRSRVSILSFFQMFCQQLQTLRSPSVLRRSMSRFFDAKSRKVTVLGAAGGIGQPLSLLLARDTNVSHLNLYDLHGTPGVAADLSHVPGRKVVKGYAGAEQLGEALRGSDVVVIPAGVPRKPGMTRDDLFNTNASIVQALARAVGDNCPGASVLIISNPVNSTVPIFAETLKAQGVYDPSRLYGVTTLDVQRARQFVAAELQLSPSIVNLPVLGGHAGTTIVPLLSRVEVVPNARSEKLQLGAAIKFSDEVRDALTHRIQFGGDEVVQAKDGAGSATLSMALAGYDMTTRVIEGLQGRHVQECAFVESSLTDAPFFASEVHIERTGSSECRVLPPMDDYERALVDAAVPDLIASYQKGVDFVKNNP
jgi:malate dehydrogenase